MKKVFTLFVVIILYLQLPAQHIGIGNNNPETALDVKGGIRSRPDTVLITQNFQIIDASNTNYIRLIRPAIVQDSNYALNITPGIDGQHLRLESSGFGVECHLFNDTYLSNGKRVLLQGIPDPLPYFSFVNYKLTYIDLIYVEELGWTQTDSYAWSNYSSERKVVILYTQLDRTFIVPYGIDSITVAVWSGGGSSTGIGKGGNGGFIAGKLKVVQGETLNMIVSSPPGSNSQAYISTIQRGTEILVLAAGGGNGSYYGGVGGNAGPIGQSGTLNTEPGTTGAPGGGATVSAGGTGGLAGVGGTNGVSGASLLGGICNTQFSNKEGCGGYGYYGGGGASTFYSSFFSFLFASGGGGGGSNYAKTTDFVTTHNTHVGNIIPANPLYDGGGLGAIGNIEAGGGKVVITW